METMVNEDIMDVKAASEYLKLKQSILYQYVNEGRVPGFKIGCLWRFKKRALDKWIKQNRQEPPKKRVMTASQARKLLRGSAKGENLLDALLRSRKEDLQIEEAKER